MYSNNKLTKLLADLGTIIRADDEVDLGTLLGKNLSVTVATVQDNHGNKAYKVDKTAPAITLLSNYPHGLTIEELVELTGLHATQLLEMLVDGEGDKYTYDKNSQKWFSKEAV